MFILYIIPQTCTQATYADSMMDKQHTTLTIVCRLWF